MYQDVRERVSNIIGQIYLLKSNQLGDTSEVIGLDRYNNLADYCDSLLIALTQEYGIDRTNEIITLANEIYEENKRMREEE